MTGEGEAGSQNREVTDATIISVQPLANNSIKLAQLANSAALVEQYKCEDIQKSLSFAES